MQKSLSLINPAIIYSEQSGVRTKVALGLISVRSRRKGLPRELDAVEVGNPVHFLEVSQCSHLTAVDRLLPVPSSRFDSMDQR